MGTVPKLPIYPCTGKALALRETWPLAAVAQGACVGPWFATGRHHGPRLAILRANGELSFRNTAANSNAPSRKRPGERWET
jgi:hypothetical protein